MPATKATTTTSGTDKMVRAIVNADLGNRYLKWQSADGTIRTLPAVVKELEDWEDAPAISPNTLNTVLLEVDGRRYVIGEAAKLSGGYPVFAEGKADLSRLLGLIALEPYPGSDKVRIEQLRYAVPDNRDKAAIDKIERLAGTFEFTVNGHDRIVTVRDVVPVEENAAAFTYASAKGLFTYPQMSNGVLSVGGGTTNVSLFSPDGTHLRQYFKVLPGTFAIAEKVAAAIGAKTGARPDPALVMDGIERGDYKAGLGVNAPYFETEFGRALETTVQEIRQTLKTVWATPLRNGEIGEVLIVGGSAPLFGGLVETSGGRFKIPTLPGQPNLTQLIVLQGMML